MHSALVQHLVGAVATHVVLLGEQSRKPVLHSGAPHVVPLHVAVPLAGGEQTVHEVPQWPASLGAQALPQRCSGEVQVKSHAPPLQIAAPPEGGVQAAQDVVPQEAMLPLDEHTPLQS